MSGVLVYLWKILYVDLLENCLQMLDIVVSIYSDL